MSAGAGAVLITSPLVPHLVDDNVLSKGTFRMNENEEIFVRHAKRISIACIQEDNLSDGVTVLLCVDPDNMPENCEEPEENEQAKDVRETVKGILRNAHPLSWVALALSFAALVIEIMRIVVTIYQI